MIKLIKPENGETLSLLTETQLKYLAMDRSNKNVGTIDYLDLKKGTNKDCSFPETIKFKWEADGNALLQLSESEDFEETISFSENNECNIDNLKCGTKYFWRVLCGDDISEIRTFETEDIYPRFIRIDGLTNVRDCGGRITTDGKRIKQGMLYRGSEMNSHVEITESGLRTMREQLKIKSVLDIRGTSEIVKDVYNGNYINIPVVPYSEWFTKPEMSKAILEYLSDKSNYPIYFHCWGGADRTGTVAFLICALLGQSYEDLIDDYEITTLSIWGARSRNSENLCKSFLEDFNKLEGNTASEKAENHFLSCGVDKATIEQFKSFMLY